MDEYIAEHVSEQPWSCLVLTPQNSLGPPTCAKGRGVSGIIKPGMCETHNMSTEHYKTSFAQRRLCVFLGGVPLL